MSWNKLFNIVWNIDRLKREKIVSLIQTKSGWLVYWVIEGLTLNLNKVDKDLSKYVVKKWHSSLEHFY